VTSELTADRDKFKKELYRKDQTMEEVKKMSRVYQKTLLEGENTKEKDSEMRIEELEKTEIIRKERDMVETELNELTETLDKRNQATRVSFQKLHLSFFT
jgi:hypothetical protein